MTGMDGRILHNGVEVTKVDPDKRAVLLRITAQRVRIGDLTLHPDLVADLLDHAANVVDTGRPRVLITAIQQIIDEVSRG